MFHRQIQDKLAEGDIKADLGVQTVFSPTGFSTLNENIVCALQHGMEYLAITDFINWTEDENISLDDKHKYIRSLYELQDIRINLIAGIEINFLPAYSYRMLRLPKLKWLTASNYSRTTNNFYAKEYTDQLKTNIMQAVEYGINAIAHPEQNLQYLMQRREHMDSTSIDNMEITTQEFFDWLVDYCKEQHLYLGISELSVRDKHLRQSVEYWVKHAIDNDNLIYLSTDSRLCTSVGDFEQTVEMCNRLGVRKQYVLNCDMELLGKMFGGGH